MAAEDSHHPKAATTKVCTTSPFEKKAVERQQLTPHQMPKIANFAAQSAKSG
jgi:hypothetical protein